MAEGKILVVDDEEVARLTLSQILRLRAAIDTGQVPTPAAEHDSDDVARRKAEEVANSESQCRWLPTRITVLFVYRQQLI